MSAGEPNGRRQRGLGSRMNAVPANRVTGIWMIYACALLGGVFFFLDLSFPLGVAGGVPYVAVVLLALWVPSAWFPIAVAFAASLLTVAGYFLSPSASAIWIVLTNRGLALFAIWVTATLGLARRRLQDRLRESLERDLRVLNELLPICASCKRIRDNSGNWHEIERYISTHTASEFTHGICPPCIKKLYPEVYSELDPG